MFTINYNDDPTLNIYALLFKDNGDCFINSVGFSTFNTDFSIVDHPIVLTESRSGYYTGVINDSEFSTPQRFHIEIYSRAGSDEVYGVDPIKASADIYWNGQANIAQYFPPEAIAIPSFGDLTVGENLQYRLSIYDNLKQLSNKGSGLRYQISRNSTLISSGVVLPTGSTPNIFYYANIPLTSFATGSYVINTSGYFVDTQGSVYLKSYSTFSIINSQSNFSVDVAGQLGYASGTVNDGAPTASSFISNLASSIDDFYNGQVWRFVEGSLIGQGKIIADYNGTTKRVHFNKPFSSTPSNGQLGIVYPIGGELGL